VRKLFGNFNSNLFSMRLNHASGNLYLYFKNSVCRDSLKVSTFLKSIKHRKIIPSREKKDVAVNVYIQLNSQNQNHKWNLL